MFSQTPKSVSDVAVTELAYYSWHGRNLASYSRPVTTTMSEDICGW